MRAEARSAPGHYDVVHSHYWLSGQVGYLAKDRWGVPLVHSAHTLAKVKNAAMADDDEPEPRGRLIGEEQVVAEADRLIANTGERGGRVWSSSTARIPRGSTWCRPGSTPTCSPRASGRGGPAGPGHRRGTTR